jgi:hypothetical protein
MEVKKSPVIVRRAKPKLHYMWSTLYVKKMWDTKNLHLCPKVCVKNMDFRVNATAV